MGDGLADRTEPQAGESTPAAVADDEHVSSLSDPHQGVGGATLDQGTADLHVGMTSGLDG